MIEEIDADGSGDIDFDEFVAVMSRKVRPLGRNPSFTVAHSTPRSGVRLRQSTQQKKSRLHSRYVRAWGLTLCTPVQILTSVVCRCSRERHPRTTFVWWI